MSQTLTDFYKNYQTTKKKPKKFGKILFALVIFCLIVCLVVSLMLTRSPKKNYASKSYYLVYADKFTSVSLATELAKKVSDLGGAGVIYTVGNTMFVVAGAYNNQEDATKVKNQILNTFIQSNVLKVETQAFSKSKSKQIENLSACKNYYKTLHEFCENLRVWGNSYDLGELDTGNLYKNIMLKKQSFASLSDGLKNLEDPFAKTMYSSSLVVLEYISSFFSSAFVSSSVSKYIKKLQITCIIEFVDMCSLIG